MPSIERVAAAVEVVELRLGDRVVDVDGREQQRARPRHLVQAVHAGGGLLGDALDARPIRGPELGLLGEAARSSARTTSNSSVSSSVGSGTSPARLVLGALVHEQGGVAAVVEDHVRAAAVGPAQHLLGAPPVLLERLALPREDRHALRVVERAVGADGDGGGGVVLGGEDVAAAQRTSAPSATSVSMSTAVWMVMCSEPVMRAPVERLGCRRTRPAGP